MSRFAENTKVSSDKSCVEIEQTLSPCGATAFSYGWMGEKLAVGFEANNRGIQFVLPVQDWNHKHSGVLDSLSWSLYAYGFPQG